jgi:hypothetical protein
LKIKKSLLVNLVLFTFGMFLYVLAVASSFVSEFYVSNTNPFLIFAITFIGGLVAVGLGYASVVVLGGMVSLKLNEFIAHVTFCKQVVEVTDEKPQIITSRAWRDFMVYMPALIFGLTLMLAWDIHNVYDPQTAIYYPILRTLDIFSKPLAADHILRPIEVIVAMTILIGIAGIAPSIALPYFRKFKITGVNSGPFHTNFLMLVVGLIVGLGTLLTLIGFIYSVLWVGKGPVVYHYVFLALLGLSLHYTIGAFLGRDKSEDMIMTQLREGERKRVVQGTVVIQGSPQASNK